jgi:hypothetical protein
MASMRAKMPRVGSMSVDSAAPYSRVTPFPRARGGSRTSSLPLRVLAVGVLVAYVALGAACGQKGDLYLPDPKNQTAQVRSGR